MNDAQIKVTFLFGSVFDIFEGDTFYSVSFNLETQVMKSEF